MFGPQLDVGRVIVDYGHQLFKRVFVSGGRQSVADLMATGALFRQTLAAYDGCLLCLREGAVDAAGVQLRVEFEASLGVYWILHSDSDRDRWGRQYYVYDVRQARHWNLCAVPNTPEPRDYMTACRESFGIVREFSPDMVAIATERVSNIERFLQSSPYRDINGWFDDLKKKRKREPEWYQSGPDAPSTLFDLARRLRRAAEYRALYRQLSYLSHASRRSGSLKFLPDGRLTIEPVRSLEQFPTVFGVAARLMVGLYLRLLEVYRPEELSVFRETYKRDWMSRLRVPEVTLRPEYVGL